MTGHDVDDPTVAYALLDSAGGRFAIDGSGHITVADGVLLDFEQSATHGVLLRVTDPGGLSFDKALTIAVNDLNPEIAVGDARDNTLFGGFADDTLNGQGGDDLLVGGGGTTTSPAAAVRTRRSVEAGNDTVIGGDGDDYLNGGADDDLIIGNDGADTLLGDTGNDYLDGGSR